MNQQTFKTKEVYIFLLPTLLLDLAVQLAVYFLCARNFTYGDPMDLVMLKSRVVYFLIVGFMVASMLYAPKLYVRGLELRHIAVNAFLQTLITLSVMAISVNILFDSFAGKLYLLCGISSTTAVFITNMIIKSAIDFARRHGRNKVHCLIVGSEPAACELCRALGAPEQYDYKMLGIFADKVPDSGLKYLGPLSGLDKYIRENKVHNLYCSIPPKDNNELVNSIIRLCEHYCIEFFYLPDMTGYISRSLLFDNIDGHNVVRLREEPLSNPVNRYAKRLLDIVLSGLLLVCVFPFVWLFAAIGIKLSSPGPIFFRQKRTGYKGQEFNMIKFRSMHVNADADRLQASKDDPRKFAFGDFLRRSSIDEIPQLINIFLGDMSFVGPRPHMLAHTEQYDALIDKYMVRHMVLPGLTGWAQVNGYRGETKTLDQMQGRVKYDIWYIEHWSPLLDLRIVFKTIVQILGGDKQAY